MYRLLYTSVIPPSNFHCGCVLGIYIAYGLVMCRGHWLLYCDEQASALIFIDSQLNFETSDRILWHYRSCGYIMGVIVSVAPRF